MSAPTPSDRRPRVAVLFGGRSSEHAISCVTAGSVLQAIDPEKYDVVPIGIAQDGHWVLESAEVERLAITGREALPSVDASLPTLTLSQEGGNGSLVVHDSGDVPRELGQVDVVFPLLHGPFGEDGTVQGLLEMADVRYVGSGVLSSAVGMDKHYMKVVLEAAGLPVLPYAVDHRPRDWRTDRASALDERRRPGLPGVRQALPWRLQHRHQQGARPRRARRRGRGGPALRPQGRRRGRRRGRRAEIECGVLEGSRRRPGRDERGRRDHRRGRPRLLRLRGEVPPRGVDPSSTCRPTSDDEIADEVRALSAAAFDALSCEGLARVDFFLLADGSIVVNEINTMPGFTPTSMFPRMWAASGLDYPALVDRLLQLALRRSTGLR